MSGPGAEVIAGIPPARLLAKERFLLARGADRRDVLRGTRTEWQQSWLSEARAAWTRRLIPDLEKWLDRPHGEINTYVCQMLSGHGSFRAHLQRLGASETDKCVYCFERDTVEHALFSCGRFTWRRAVLERKMGSSFAPEAVVDMMCRHVDGWNEVCTYVKEVMVRRECDSKTV